MIIAKQVFEDMINSPKRSFRGRVEVFEGSTLALVCGCHDNLKSFTVNRTGEKDKLFGYGICQKLTANLLDRDRKLNITKNHSLEVEFGVGTDYVYPCPRFYIDKITRDENTNELTIEAYDALYAAAAHYVSELNLPESYTIGEFAAACAALLGVPVNGINLYSFNTVYPAGANFEGTETIREALNAVAEATQTIYYIDSNWELTFKRLDIEGEPVATIDKSKYMTLTNKELIVLGAVCHATELGDNVIEPTGEEGTTQFIRNNPFWDMREDVADLVKRAANAVSGLAITQFDCSWRGNFLLEIGDKISLITKDDNEIISYLLDDSFTFNGGLSEKTQWSYSENDGETAANPTTLGEALKQTYARVDKANKTINLLVSENNANKSTIAALEMNTANINATVSELSNTTTQALGDMSGEVAQLKNQVSATMTRDQILFEIESELSNGVSQVKTATDFTFDENGLRIAKSESEIETVITQDGMSVYRNGTEVLTANNEGVKAIDLHAETYLVIGKTSRLEDYNGRTACFWIGG